MLALAPADSERQLIVYKGSDTRLPSGRVFGIANGFYDFDEEVPPWTHIGSRSSPCASRLASAWCLLPVQLVRASFDRSFDNI